MIGEIRREKQKGESSIARLKKDGEVFEILVDCKEAIDLRKGESSIDKALLVPEVFKNARTGDKHGDLTKYFDTDDIYRIAEEIITKGEVQLTTSYRNELIEKKTNQLINELIKRAVDPNTKMPIPAKRIELGLKSAGVKVDYEKSINEQIDEIVAKLSEVMPIKITELELKVRLKPHHASKCYGVLKHYGSIIKQEYLPDGSMTVIINIPAGLRLELTNELNNLTQGMVLIEEVE